MPTPKTAAKPPAAPGQFTAKGVDAVLRDLEAALAKVAEARGDDKALAKAEFNFLAAVARLRDTLVGLLREHHCGKQVIPPIFGGDSDRLQRIHSVLDPAQLSEASADDYRLRSCLDARDSVGRVLEAYGPKEEPLQRCPSYTEPAREKVVPPDAQGLKPSLSGTAEEELEAPKEDGSEAGGSEAPKPGPDEAESRREERPEHLFASGGRYKGQWLDGLRDGAGLQIWPDGERYEGQFLRGGVHGEGCYTQPDGMMHTGQWHRGKQHGQGAEVFPDGTKYVGQYVGGSKTGKGTYTFAEGSVYEGEFRENNIHGQGTYIWAGGGNGRKYHGQWANNQMHGTGDFSFADGRRYVGEYVKDHKHGVGTFTWPDGRQYQGQWRNGKQHGNAQYRDATGEVHATKWVNGRPSQPTL